MTQSKEEFINSTVTLDEARVFLGCKSKERLRMKVKKGIIPAFKVGNRWMIYIKDLQNYADSQKNTR